MAGVRQSTVIHIRGVFVRFYDEMDRCFMTSGIVEGALIHEAADARRSFSIDEVKSAMALGIPDSGSKAIGSKR